MNTNNDDEGMYDKQVDTIETKGLKNYYQQEMMIYEDEELYKISREQISI